MNNISMRMRREAMGLSQEDFGVLLGKVTNRSIKQITINRWEMGVRKPQDWMIIHLAICVVEDLFRDLMSRFFDIAETEADLANSPDVEFTVYMSDERFKKAEPELAELGISPTMHRMAAAQAALDLSEEGYNIQFIEG